MLDLRAGKMGLERDTLARDCPSHVAGVVSRGAPEEGFRMIHLSLDCIRPVL